MNIEALIVAFIMLVATAVYAPPGRPFVDEPSRDDGISRDPKIHSAFIE